MDAMADAEPSEKSGPAFRVHFNFGGYAFCGAVSHYRLADDDVKVTCKRCLNRLGGQEERTR